MTERPVIDYFLEELRLLRAEQTERHQRMRSEMHAGFDKVTMEVRQRLDDHSGRLLIIETERKVEQTQSVRRGTWAGILAATGLTALMKVIEGTWYR